MYIAFVEIDENIATWKAIEQSTSEKQIEEIDIGAQELVQGKICLHYIVFNFEKINFTKKTILL